MARFKNTNWTLPQSADGSVGTWEQAQVAVLMDIRDELQTLNRTLSCHRVPAGMDALVRMDKRLARRISLRPKAKPAKEAT